MKLLSYHENGICIVWGVDEKQELRLLHMSSLPFQKEDARAAKGLSTLTCALLYIQFTSELIDKSARLVYNITRWLRKQPRKSE